MRCRLARALIDRACRPLAGGLHDLAEFLQSARRANPRPMARPRPTPPRRARTPSLPRRRRSACRSKSEKGLLGSDPNDDLSRGKRQYRVGNYGLAESSFRHAVELHPRDAEAWLGLGRLLRPAAPLRSRRPRLCAGDPHRRADGRDPQQPGLFLHAARRLQARARDAAQGAAQGPEEQIRRQQPAAPAARAPASARRWSRRRVTRRSHASRPPSRR